MNRIFAILLLGLFSLPGYACEYHQGTFGGGFGGFGGGNFNAQAAMQTHHLSRQPAKIKITHPATITAKLGETAKIDISYSLPFSVANAKMTISSTEQLTLIKNEVKSLRKRKGKQEVAFVINQAGAVSYTHLTLPTNA